MLNSFLIKNIAEEFNLIRENPTIGISVDGFLWKRVLRDSGAKGKRDFYEGIDCLQRIAKDLNQDRGVIYDIPLYKCC